MFNPSASEFQVAIVVTPKKTVAACYCTLNAFGEFGEDFPYSGYIMYKDANDECWIVENGEVLPFDCELLEVK